MRPLLIAGLAAAVVLGFTWGYGAGTRGWFPAGRVKSVAAALKSPAPASNDASPKRDPAWREKASFFTAFPAPAAVVMIGDSITDGAEWNEMFPDVGIANRGIDGDTTDGVLERMDGILAVHANKAFVMLGINDFIRGRSVEQAFADYAKIVQLLEQSGARVYVQSTLLCNLKLATVYSCSENSIKIRQLNERLARLASKQVVFIDLNAALADDGGLKVELTYDGVHLNGQGYGLWKDVIAPFMRAQAD